MEEGAGLEAVLAGVGVGREGRSRAGLGPTDCDLCLKDFRNRLGGGESRRPGI